MTVLDGVRVGLIGNHIKIYDIIKPTAVRTQSHFTLHEYVSRYNLVSIN